MKKSKKAIILCSGGLDSVVTAHYVKKVLHYRKLIILFCNYAQRTLVPERASSQKCAKDLHAEFKEVNLSYLKKIIPSLLNTKKKINVKRKINLKNTIKESKTFYVPLRNTIFLVNALALSEFLFLNKKETYAVFIGFKSEGKETYPDVTKKFLRYINGLKKFGTYKEKIYAPLINKDKDEIIVLGKRLGVDLTKTYSCYMGSRNLQHCGLCLACKLRKAAFYWANVPDQTIYSSKSINN